MFAPMRNTHTHTILAAALALAAGVAAAQPAGDWPRRPVRVVVPAAPGGGGDVTVRALSPALTEALGQQVIVDNRPGAAGNIGSELVARAQPDGYTVLAGNISTMAINPTGYAAVLRFDAARDLTAVTLVTSIPNALVAGAALPPNTLAELIAYARARPGQLNYSNPIGGVSHLDMLELLSRAGVQMVNVPSKGAGSSFAPIMTGEIQCSFLNIATIIPLVKAGRMKAYATTAKRRVADLPEVPTMAEAGYPGVGSEFWIGFFMPSATPRAVIDRFYATVAEVMRRPQVRDSFEKAKLPVVVSASPAEFQAYVSAERKRWAAILKNYDIQFQ